MFVILRVSFKDLSDTFSHIGTVAIGITLSRTGNTYTTKVVIAKIHKQNLNTCFMITIVPISTS